MSAVKDCFRVTDELYRIVQNPLEDRERMVSAIEELLDKRQALLAEIRPPFDEAERRLGQEMIRRNAVINASLSKIKEDIQKDLKGVSKKKGSMNKYTRPFASVRTDGVFYDKKN
ncbi:flagellar protein FliT [Bacillus xiapuensis]|uniref:flagellar protein FliT n=1 Tax=Bacillus xiapuensis TaxID=2014075 RepID=UPI000C250C4F|nr:flagellar protein FliT [Bacillus xiapuensis]